MSRGVLLLGGLVLDEIVRDGWNITKSELL